MNGLYTDVSANAISDAGQSELMGQVNKTIYIILFACIIFAICLLVVNTPEGLGESSDVCQIHKAFFQIKMDSAIVTEKYVDNKNHALKTVKIKTSDKLLKLYFIPDVDSTEFETIEVGDLVSKETNTFTLNVINKRTITLDYACQY